MSKHDLRARPIYHRTRDSIDAHRTIVFAALEVTHWIEPKSSGASRKFVRTARRGSSAASYWSTTDYQEWQTQPLDQSARSLRGDRRLSNTSPISATVTRPWATNSCRVHSGMRRHAHHPVFRDHQLNLEQTNPTPKTGY
jgi:hypothetical protein